MLCQLASMSFDMPPMAKLKPLIMRMSPGRYSLLNFLQAEASSQTPAHTASLHLNNSRPYSPPKQNMGVSTRLPPQCADPREKEGSSELDTYDLVGIIRVERAWSAPRQITQSLCSLPGIIKRGHGGTLFELPFTCHYFLYLFPLFSYISI